MVRKQNKQDGGRINANLRMQDGGKAMHGVTAKVIVMTGKASALFGAGNGVDLC